jgi:hypothetical protein
MNRFYNHTCCVLSKFWLHKKAEEEGIFTPKVPLLAIHALVNRKTKAGKPIGASQKISVIEALKLYTINAAYHSFDKNDIGSIEIGKLVDFVILGEDILAIPPEKIKEIPLIKTIIEGKFFEK